MVEAIGVTVFRLPMNVVEALADVARMPLAATRPAVAVTIAAVVAAHRRRVCISVRSLRLCQSPPTLATYRRERRFDPEPDRHGPDGRRPPRRHAGVSTAARPVPHVPA